MTDREHESLMRMTNQCDMSKLAETITFLDESGHYDLAEHIARAALEITRGRSVAREYGWSQNSVGFTPTPSEPSERLSSGDAIACISMALQNPVDTQEWARLLSDCRHVIEKLEDELTAAKRSRNDEQRLRIAE